jgi:hypothetical protein
VISQGSWCFIVFVTDPHEGRRYSKRKTGKVQFLSFYAIFVTPPLCLVESDISNACLD